MTTTTTQHITRARLTHAELDDGQTAPWDVLIRAATQDRIGFGRDHRGCPLPPNHEHELAAWYRALLRTAQPLIEREAKAAYRRYCGVGVTTRRDDGVHAIGLGSWVAGPDPALQTNYRAWDALLDRVRGASA